MSTRKAALLADLPQPGEMIAGKYRVERLLGAGGMGVVLEAVHAGLGQRVAIKCLAGEAASDPARIERFQREAWTGAKIQNDHIVRVTDVGQLDEGGAFIVMEYLEGEDLDRVLKKGALPLSTAVDYLLQAGEAMAEAHKAGIIHRDLKPANLFLTQRGDGSPLVKVLDFGISKISEGALTATQSLMGSPLYMAPEQLRSAKYVDPRSDIWSLGVILYQLVTGVTPYAGDTLPEICTRILHDPPTPIHEQGVPLPAQLSGVMERWLAKEPATRYQNLAEVAVAVAPYGGESATTSAAFICRVLGHDASALTPAPAQGRRSAGARGAVADDEVTRVHPGSHVSVPAAAPPGTASHSASSPGGAFQGASTMTEQMQLPVQSPAPQPSLSPGRQTLPSSPHLSSHLSSPALPLAGHTVPSSMDLQRQIGATTASPVAQSSFPTQRSSRGSTIAAILAVAVALVVGVVVVSFLASDEASPTESEPSPASAATGAEEESTSTSTGDSSEAETTAGTSSPLAAPASSSEDTEEETSPPAASASASAGAPSAAPAPRSFPHTPAPRPTPKSFDPYRRR